MRRGVGLVIGKTHPHVGGDFSLFVRLRERLRFPLFYFIFIFFKKQSSILFLNLLKHNISSQYYERRVQWCTDQGCSPRQLFLLHCLWLNYLTFQPIIELSMFFINMYCIQKLILLKLIYHFLFQTFQIKSLNILCQT